CSRECSIESCANGDLFSVTINRSDFPDLGQGAVLPTAPAPRSVPWATENRSPNDIGIIVGVHIDEHDVADLNSRARGHASERESVGALYGIVGEVEGRAAGPRGLWLYIQD